MSTLHCPLCGLRFRWASELAGHARDDHAEPHPPHLPPPRPRPADRYGPRPAPAQGRSSAIR